MTLPIVPSSIFDYDAADQTFAIEMSTLAGNYPVVTRSNEFGIKSTRTGQIAPFRFERKFMNFGAAPEDVELGGWVFAYAGNKAELMDVRVVIFND